MSSEMLFADVVAPLICSNKYEWFELDDLNIYRTMQYQKALANNNASFKLMDAAHEASFRGGLSNSIFAPDQMLSLHEHPMESIMVIIISSLFYIL